ncbi:type IV secretion system protein VirB3 [Rubellimicrobium aerolatum]|uniref:Type IV secretion system protein VirB3 n=1 Tax=Rubellimicrobium aerolatum TaxID=490979 RepID=A0ABW0SDW3_9RHOB|nr:VirB3 family type IV secretion system protein [Rubellimicrobium aerolatum]MBP1806981.1 type IV secretion system protein VirB3 [Rubellimicrobium aerolatum]
MAEQTRLFIGLIRPPKLLGLPILYAVVWLFGSALLFLWVQHWVVPVLALLAYPAIWKAADWDPHVLDVVATVLQHTPPSLNRSRDGRIHYAP